MTPEHARSIAGQIGWLSRQPSSFREALLGKTQLRRVPAGEAVTSLDEKPNGIACVVDGFVDVLVAPGPFPMKLAYIARSGWWFGDVALISGSARRAGLLARSESWVLHLPERKVSWLADEHGDAWRRFAELTVAHFDNALYLAASRSTPDLHQRLAGLICWLSGADFFSEVIEELPITREEIGEIAGLSRNTAGRVLADLARDGLIEARYGRLVIIDRMGLELLLRH